MQLSLDVFDRVERPESFKVLQSIYCQYNLSEYVHLSIVENVSCETKD